MRIPKNLTHKWHIYLLWVILTFCMFTLNVQAQGTDTIDACTIAKLTSYNTPIPCQEERNLYPNLNHAIQRIPSIFIAVPNEDGSRKEETAVEMSATATTLKIHGSLVTNNNQRNKATTSGDRKNFSILWGSDNIMEGSIGESTIIGGKENKITTQMGLIAGGTKNQILAGDRSTILWGRENRISWPTSTIIGRNSSISGESSTIIGAHNTIAGNNSLAAGRGANVEANSSFAWNDGTTTLNVKQSHLFAIKGTKGMIVGKDTPHTGAALSIKGALRIQLNESKNALMGAGFTCASTLAGTVKTVKAVFNQGLTNTDQVCPCLCNGSKREAMLTTPQCINACEWRSPQDIEKDKPICWSTFNTCNRGTVVTSTFSYVYGALGGNVNHQWTTPSALNHRYRVCENADTNVSVTCEVNFSCQWNTPANANICNYSAGNSTKKDDRELSQNVNKALIGVVSNRCLSDTDTTPKTRTELDNQINNCNNSDAQSKKCEFYCPDGRHRESDGNCYQNSCKYDPINSETASGNKYVTFNPSCLNHGTSVTDTKTVRSADGHGTWTFVGSFSCSLGVRTKGETTTLTCDSGYYGRDKGTATTYDDECIEVQWRTSKNFPTSCPASYSTSNQWCSVSCGGGQYRISCTNGYYSDSRTVYCNAVQWGSVKKENVDKNVCREYYGQTSEPTNTYSCTSPCPSSSRYEGSCNTHSCCSDDHSWYPYSSKPSSSTCPNGSESMTTTCNNTYWKCSTGGGTTNPNPDGGTSNPGGGTTSCGWVSNCQHCGKKYRYDFHNFHCCGNTAPALGYYCRDWEYEVCSQPYIGCMYGGTNYPTGTKDHTGFETDGKCSADPASCKIHLDSKSRSKANALTNEAMCCDAYM